MSKYLFCLGAAIVGAPLAAQEPPQIDDTLVDYAQLALEEDHLGYVDPVATIPDKAIVVVASGLPSHRTASSYPVTVIADAELRAIQGPDLTHALRRLPGVTLTRNGGLGGFTGVRVRGAGAEQLFVLIDGVKVNDVSAPAGGFDFGNLMADEIGKVELLRGSHSVIWGSDALAGVMNLSTRAVDGVVGSAEYGGARQFSGQALAGVHTGDIDATLAGGAVRARGISASDMGTERDGFGQWHLSGRARAYLAGGWHAVAAARYARGELEIDGYPAPLFAFADTLERQDTRERSGSVGIEHKGDRLMLRANASRSVNHRDLIDEAAGPAPYYRTHSRLSRAELFGEYRLSGALDDVRINFGAAREWTRFAADGAFSSDRGDARITSGHALMTYDDGGVTLGAGARYDSHSRFGGEWTFGANGALALGADWSLRGSYGEGFKAPTLFQLLSDYGNGALIPERSRSYDLGLAHGSRDGATHFAASLFRRDSRDLIDFVSCFGVAGGICAGRPFGTYDNVGRARARGFELEGNLRLPGRTPGYWPVQLRAAYSYVKAIDRIGGRDLARRPRHALTLSGDWQIDAEHVFATTLGADLRMVGDSFDDAANAVPVDGHALVDLRASRPLLEIGGVGGRSLDLFGRVENVFDARYTEVAGYRTQGRAAYVGLRVGW